MEGAVGEGIVSDVEVSVPVEEGPGPMFRAPDFTPCYNYAESVNPLFDPRRVLLRRTFFNIEDTCLLATTRPATIYPWWKWAPRTRCLFVSRRNTCGHSLNICQESARPCVVTSNIRVGMANSDYRQPEPTTLPECTTVKSISVCISQSCDI